MRLLLAAALLLSGCGEVWNDPYPAAERGANTLYTSFTERPKHLDPASTITEDEAKFTRQVYEPPVQYHYLRRPYELVPLVATEVPAARPGADGKSVSYEIRIRPGVRFQPHPAFHAPNRQLDRATIAGLRTPYDLPQHADRELEADDYIYQIKRLAHPRLNSPIFGLMADSIVGMKSLGERLKAAAKTPGWIDLREHALEGVEKIDRHAFRIRLSEPYPQFVYWLAMPYFAPMPWEAEQFFHQPGMAEKNFNLNWWPVGTGPYMLVENDPNARMVLRRNPNFRGEPYPSEGAPGDREEGLLADAGKPMPFIDEVRFVREKEAIPFWNKFLQGYYDQSGIPADAFDNAVRVSIEGDTSLTPEMEAKGIRLRTSVATSVFYLGFNMEDAVVGSAKGGAGAERARKLRQAISIAVDWEEYISIFLSGRGIAAQGPIPPGIFGWEEGEASLNPVTHEWKDGRAVRRPVEHARKLLAEAGYPDGRDANSGTPLVLYLDTVARGPGDKPRFDWWRKQFAKLSIQLEIRDTDWNRLQDKLRKGSQQLFILGWNGDYPDPENFLFLLHGAQGRANGDGVNSSNYANPAYDALFPRMKNLPNGPQRAAAIREMVDMARQDAPWVFGFYPKDYGLSHGWMANGKPNDMAGNTLKYLRIDTARRAALRAEWNRPVLWPAIVLALLVAAIALPAIASVRRRERRAARAGA